MSEHASNFDEEIDRREIPAPKPNKIGLGADRGGSRPARIRALGFIGMMTAGMHHQAHHLALAAGRNPHDH